ncbi:MAG: hypothetical protein M3552_21925 [Planctomycetota bacterium]|nr:hypothetical protein [Planctomycetota bacterium]
MEEEEPSWWQAWVLYLWDLADQYLWQPVLCAMKKGFCWLADMLLRWGTEAFELLMEEMPDLSEHEAAISGFVQWMRLANAWLPLDWSLGILTGYFAFVVVVIVVKWILKLIPTIG